jgi:thioredoxin reductase (NADPH)
MDIEKLVIIGAGPAGYTAGIYASRASLNPVLFEGIQPGGQLLLTNDVENYPGFPDGIMGPELMDKMRAQAQRFGTTIFSDIVKEVDFKVHPFIVNGSDKEIKAHSVIIATGASARWLGIPSEEQFKGRGVSACATCDGAFFREKEIIVVGGGDTAMEEATFLTKFAKKIYIVHRRDQFRASKIMQEKALNHPKIEAIWNSTIDEITGSLKVAGVKLKDTVTGNIRDMAIQGIFIALGHTPNTRLNWIRMDTLFFRIQHRPKPMSKACLPAGMSLTTNTARLLPQRVPAVPRHWTRKNGWK